MGGQQVVNQTAYLCQIQLCGGARIQHRGVIDMVAVFREQRLHRQVLHIYIGPHHRNQLWRNIIDWLRVQAGVYLYAGGTDQSIA